MLLVQLFVSHRLILEVLVMYEASAVILLLRHTTAVDGVNVTDTRLTEPVEIQLVAHCAIHTFAAQVLGFKPRRPITSKIPIIVPRAIVFIKMLNLTGMGLAFGFRFGSLSLLLLDSV